MPLPGSASPGSCSACLRCSLSAAPAASPPRDQHLTQILPTQTLTTFDNGLRLLVDPVPEVKTFALTALIYGGARFEDAGQSGWAHLLEHMVFKGAGDATPP